MPFLHEPKAFHVSIREQCLILSWYSEYQKIHGPLYPLPPHDLPQPAQTNVCDEAMLREQLLSVVAHVPGEAPHSTPPLIVEEGRTQGGQTFEKKKEAIPDGEMEKDMYMCIYIYLYIWRWDSRGSETLREAEKGSMLKGEDRQTKTRWWEERALGIVQSGPGDMQSEELDSKNGSEKKDFGTEGAVNSM